MNTGELTEKSKVVFRLGAVPVLIAGIFAAGFKAKSIYDSFYFENQEAYQVVTDAIKINQEAIKANQQNIEANRAVAAQAAKDRFHGSEFETWLKMFRALNTAHPELVIPEKP